MEEVVRAIINDFDDYLRAPSEEGFFGEFTDISRTSPEDLADRGVTIHFNRVLPTISITRLAAKLTDEFLVRGLRPRAYLDGSPQELHIPGVF